MPPSRSAQTAEKPRKTAASGGVRPGARPDFKAEKRLGHLPGSFHVAGIDEAGRGPLAGPVVAGAVVWRVKPPAKLAARIHDSKLLSREEREALYPEIMAHCHWAVAEASVAEIDAINILQATFLAMRRALDGLACAVHHALVDGNRLPKDMPVPATPIVGGDGLSLSIAAASILAKVTRDRAMAALAAAHPEYGWAENAGYGTPQHMAALKAHGATPHHRRSFAPVREILDGMAITAEAV